MSWVVQNGVAGVMFVTRSNPRSTLVPLLGCSQRVFQSGAPGRNADAAEETPARANRRETGRGQKKKKREAQRLCVMNAVRAESGNTRTKTKTGSKLLELGASSWSEGVEVQQQPAASKMAHVVLSALGRSLGTRRSGPAFPIGSSGLRVALGGKQVPKSHPPQL